METFYLAVCRDCQPVLPMPFYDEAERDRWADQHAVTGHTVDRKTERR